MISKFFRKLATQEQESGTGVQERELENKDGKTGIRHG
jgi:hypothetical protein